MNHQVKILKSICLYLLLALFWVASSALAQQPQDRHITGSGTASFLSDEDCDINDGTFEDLDACVEIAGTARGQGFGRVDFELSLNILFSKFLPNGSVDGGCSPASGTFAVTVANASFIIATIAGFVCEVPTDAAPTPLTFDGSFILTGSGEQLTGTQGTGRLTLSIKGEDSLLLVQGVFL